VAVYLYKTSNDHELNITAVLSGEENYKQNENGSFNKLKILIIKKYEAHLLYTARHREYGQK
jgi:hypothetical protein